MAGTQHPNADVPSWLESGALPTGILSAILPPAPARRPRGMPGRSGETFQKSNLLRDLRLHGRGGGVLGLQGHES